MPLRGVQVVPKEVNVFHFEIYYHHHYFSSLLKRQSNGRYVCHTIDIILEALLIA